MDSNRGKSVFARFSSMVMVLLVLLFLGACGDGEQSADGQPDTQADGLKSITLAGKLVVGTSADYPPYEFYLDGDEEGRIVGLDMDIAQDIADALDVSLEIKDLHFSELFSHLEAGDVDLVIAGLTPTEPRRRLADFSEIYYQAFQTVLIRKGDQDKIPTASDLRGKRVGVQVDSIQQDLAPTLIVGAEFVPVKKIHQMIEMLENGEVDALVLEKPVAEAFQARRPTLANIAAGIDANRLGSAIAVRKGNRALLERVNAVIRRLKEQNRIINYVEDAKILANK